MRIDEVHNKPLTDEERKIVEENHDLIYYYMNKLNIPRHLVDDYYDECAKGLMRAARTYNPEIGAFSTYAVKCMRTTCSNFAKANKRKIEEGDEPCLPLDKQINGAEDNLATYKDFLATYDDTIFKFYFNEVWDKIISKFSERDQKIIIDYLKNGYTYRELARVYNISHERIRYVIDRFRNSFQKEWGKSSVVEIKDFRDSGISSLFNNY